MNGSRFSALLRSTLTLPVIAGAALGVGSPALAITSFVSPFAPTDFTLTNTPTGDGTVNTVNAASGEVILTGSNNDSLSSSSTTQTTGAIAQAYTITFAWSFAGDDTPYDGDTGDQAGYLVNGVATYLANVNDQSGGPVIVNLLAGQTFGFIVDTAENTGSAGVFTVTNFDATPVPLESDALPIFISLAFLGGGLWVKRKSSRRRQMEMDLERIAKGG
ncbi:MAG: PEP-CTERM sorting domain-containing protein [Cyanobacteriota bacterium]